MIYCSGWGRKMAQAEFSGAIAAILLMAGSALAANECAGLRHHNALARRPAGMGSTP